MKRLEMKIQIKKVPRSKKKAKKGVYQIKHEKEQNRFLNVK